MNRFFVFFIIMYNSCHIPDTELSLTGNAFIHYNEKNLSLQP